MATGDLRHRPDIDGLRAIAVTSVVAFHAGLPGVPGGFVGVDVFFVISGFLITRLLLDEIAATGRVDLVAFFARRARRLLPAFLLVAMSSLVLGAWLLVPLHNEQIGFARTVSCAALYVANWCFAAKADGYFEPGAETFPFLHTWSLSVEEQFYFVWPALLIVLLGLTTRFALDLRRAVTFTLSAVFAASLGFSIVGALGDANGAARGFYHTGARAWELAAGALLATAWPMLTARPHHRGDLLARLGLLAIGASVIFLHGGLSYPGYAALLPVFGSVAVILGGGLAPRGLVPRLLSTAPMAAVGLVSYGWYLWHWPLLAMARSHSLGEHDLVRDIVLVLLGLVLAAVSYRLIEEPIRRRRVLTDWTGERTLLAAGAATMAVILAANLLSTWSARRIDDPADPLASVQFASRDINPLRATCNQNYPFVALPESEGCIPKPKPGQTGTVLVWGDSHADHLVPLVQAAGERYNWATGERTLSACAPLAGAVPVISGFAKPDCRAFNDAVLAEIETLKARGPVRVVLAGRWLAYQAIRVLAIEDRKHIYRLTADASGGRDESLAGLARGLTATLDALERLQVPVVLVAPMPEQRYAIPWCLARRQPAECATTRAENNARRSDVMAVLGKTAAGRGGVRLVDPIDALCDAATCPGRRGPAVLYSDDDHISATAAKGLAAWFDEPARWLASRLTAGR